MWPLHLFAQPCVTFRYYKWTSLSSARPFKPQNAIQLQNLLQINHPFHSQSAYWSVMHFTMTMTWQWCTLRASTTFHQIPLLMNNPPLVICCKNRWWRNMCKYKTTFSNNHFHHKRTAVLSPFIYYTQSKNTRRIKMKQLSKKFPFNHACQVRL